MANWFDFLSLAVTVAIFGGLIYGAVVAFTKISEAINNTKESLKGKGVHITDKGVSVKTSSRYTREDYIDATQRGFIKGMSAAQKAGSFATANNIEGAPAVHRQDSAASMSSISGSSSTEKGKKMRKSTA